MVLEVRDLTLTINTPAGPVTPLRGVSLSVDRGRILAVIGESGSGKSLTLKSVLRVVQAHSTEVTGSIRYNGAELLNASEKELRNIRGNRIAMIYQDPVAVLDPVFSVGSQIIEVIQRHRGMSRKEAAMLAIQLLSDLGISSPESRMKAYPHEMSGGMCQRVMIAIALACKPDLLLADEPTSALDVTVQAQIIVLLRDFVANADAGLVIVTHDVGVAAELADDVAVMYAGEVVESGSVHDVLESPQHPYTRALIGSNVTLDTVGRLPAIAGVPPDPRFLPVGCAFRPRCSEAVDACRQRPPVIQVHERHEARCLKAAS